jgi:SprT protein
MNEPQRQSDALYKTHQLVASAEHHFNLPPIQPEIHFDLKGKAAGLLVIYKSGQYKIRYNNTLLEQYGDQFLAQTVPHEVAHLIAHRLYGPGIKPHGKAWRSIMKYFNTPAIRCHNYDTTNSTVRKIRYFNYRCGCRNHRISAIRHNRVLAGTTYLCRLCGSSLVLAETR